MRDERGKEYFRRERDLVFEMVWTIDIEMSILPQGIQQQTIKSSNSGVYWTWGRGTSPTLLKKPLGQA